jgi:hypothetical protein
LTHATSGVENWGGVDIPLEQVTPKRSSSQTKHLMQNQRFCAKGQEQDVERKNFKSELICEFCGCKITRRKVTQDLCVISTKKTPPKCSQIRQMENHPKRLWKSIKRNMHEIKGFDTRLRGSIHYESLSHIRLQATHKNHISWMARSSNKEPTLSSLPLTKSTSK